MPIERAALSAIGHAGMPFWSPVSVAVLDALVDALAIPVGANVFDIGRGDGAMLVHVVGRVAGTGTGVDRLPGALALARRRVGPVRWADSTPAGAPPDLVIAVGSLPAQDAAAQPGFALLLGELVGLGGSPIDDLPVPGLGVPTRHGWRLVDRVLLGEGELRA